MSSTVSRPQAGSSGLSPRQLATFREQLEQQRRFRLEQLDQLRTGGSGPSVEVDMALATGARVALRDVLAALHRMDAGTYGRCVDCGSHLPMSQLEVIPAVAQCQGCRS